MPQPLTNTDALRRKVKDLTGLPTLPGVVRFISDVVEDTQSSLQDVGEIIARDQVLSAKILRMVNSPFYGFPGRISSVTHALVLLGLGVVKGLILSTAVFDNLDRKHRGLWEHSLGTAVISRQIAKHRAMQDCEDIMIAGLLHDLGKVVLAVVEPEQYDQCIDLAMAQGIHIAQAERECFGVDHTTVAAWVSERWHLPLQLVECLTMHHRPLQAYQHPEAVAIVHVADILARAMGYGAPGDNVLPPFEPQAFHGLALSPESYDALLRAAEEDFHRGTALFGKV